MIVQQQRNQALPIGESTLWAASVESKGERFVEAKTGGPSWRDGAWSAWSRYEEAPHDHRSPDRRREKAQNITYEDVEGLPFD